MQAKRRIAVKVEYAGERFCGSQLQSGQRTVQLELEQALNVLFRTDKPRDIKVAFSGRTDSGVHAVGQVAHFDLTHEFLLRSDHAGSSAILAGLADPSNYLDPGTCQRICWALNGILPADLSIVRAQEIRPDFDARYSARRRTYVYRILNRAQRPALGHKTQYFLNWPLELESMKLAAGSLLGINDFSAFKSSNREKVSTICRVDRAEILNKGEGELEFWISADHFVYNMVRIIVGTLVEVGLGKRDPSDLSQVLAGKDRHLAGPTAPPWGLCLYSVEYPAEFNLFQNSAGMLSGD
jgi:tRNA pseudouridine38-40 synthase